MFTATDLHVLRTCFPDPVNSIMDSCPLIVPANLTIRPRARPLGLEPWSPAHVRQTTRVHNRSLYMLPLARKLGLWSPAHERADGWHGALLASQHPLYCNEHKYLLLEDDLWGSGFGFDAKLMALALLLAVSRSRVLLWVPASAERPYIPRVRNGPPPSPPSSQPDGTPRALALGYEAGRWCDRPPYTLDCMWLPLTHCSPPASDALESSPSLRYPYGRINETARVVRLRLSWIRRSSGLWQGFESPALRAAQLFFFRPRRWVRAIARCIMERDGLRSRQYLSTFIRLSPEKAEELRGACVEPTTRGRGDDAPRTGRTCGATLGWDRPPHVQWDRPPHVRHDGKWRAHAAAQQTLPPSLPPLPPPLPLAFGGMSTGVPDGNRRMNRSLEGADAPPATAPTTAPTTVPHAALHATADAADRFRNRPRLPTVDDYEALSAFVLRRLGLPAVHVQTAHGAAIHHFARWANRTGVRAAFTRNPRSDHDTEGGRSASASIAMWHGVTAAVNLHLAAQSAAVIGLSASMWSTLCMLALPLAPHAKCAGAPSVQALLQRRGVVYKTTSRTRDERLLEFECPYGFGMTGRVRVALHESIDAHSARLVATADGRKQHHWRRTEPEKRQVTPGCVAIDVDTPWCVC